MADHGNAYSVVIADLKAQRDELDKMIAKLETLASGKPIAVSDAAESVTSDEAAPGADDQENPYLGMSIVDAAKVVLNQRRKAMSPNELVEALEAGGLLLSGSNKANTIGSVMNRRQKQVGDIVSPKRGQWGLKEWYPGRNFAKKASDDGGDSRESEASTDPETSAPARLVTMPGIVLPGSSG